jgi:hypothetical protein
VSHQLHIARRRNGGIRLAQGPRFLLFDAEEARQLAAELDRLTQMNSAVAQWRDGAETATQSGDL